MSAAIPEDGVCFLVGAGEMDPALVLSPRRGDLLVAVDGGWTAVEAMGLTADLAVGDFDSLGRVPSCPVTIPLPREKDDTDMFFALKQGLARGYRRFALYGGTGGLLAHTLANLQLLDHLSRLGCRGFLVGGGTISTAVTNGELSFPAGMEGYLSVFCSSGQARGVTLSGLYYPLEGAILTGSLPLGVSNEFLPGQSARVRVEEGTLLVLWQGRDLDAGVLRRL